MSEMSRRTFLWLTGGSSIALASNPPRKLINKLIPKVIPPEEIRPGFWQQYATTCRECPAGCGMHLWHRDGRVTKAEGNPDHPVNRGGLCARGQASLQGLYDPDRLQLVQFHPKGEPLRQQSWEEALSSIASQLSGGGPGGPPFQPADRSTRRGAEILCAGLRFGPGSFLRGVQL